MKNDMKFLIFERGVILMIENYYINKLKYELKGENKSLLYRLNELFNLLIQFIRKLLQRGNDYAHVPIY